MTIKNYQIANNTITKNKIKLTGQNALTGEDIKISPTSNDSIKQVLDNKADAGSNQLVIGTGTEAQLKFNATNTDARIIIEKGTAPYPEFKYNNTSSKWEFTDNGSEWKTLSSISGESWEVITNNTLNAEINKGYIIKSSSQCIITLPSSFSVGSKISILGNNATWRINVTGEQYIQVGQLKTTTNGYIESTSNYDIIIMICVEQNKGFQVINMLGNINIE